MMTEDERVLREQREKFHIRMCGRVNELDASVEADRRDLLEWISNDSENFTRLKKPGQQYFREICDLFVCSRLKKTDDSSGKDRFCYSLDFHPCIKLDYVTYKNEEIEYRDSELGIITYLESQFTLVFKLMNSMQLLKALDMNAADLSIGNVYEKLRTIALEAWREVATDVVEKEGIGFYHFVQNFGAIAEKLTAVLNKKLSSYGVIASDVTIRRMSVPDSVREQIRKNSFETKCESDRYAAEVKVAEMYLENYRRKAEIRSTFGTDESLTEFEKDRALERYLVRVNNERKTEIVDTKLAERTDDYGLEKPTEPKKPTIARPEAPGLKLNNKYCTGGAIIGLVLLIVGSILVSLVPSVSALGTALLVIGILGIVGCAAVLAVRVVRFNKQKAVLQEEYDAQMKLYNDAQEQYKADMAEYRKQMERYKANLSAKDGN